MVNQVYMRSGLVYKYTSKTTNKSYIGRTIMDRFQRRQYEHKTCCKDTKDSLFYKAKIEYGYDDFTLTVLEDNIPLEYLDAREIYWINYYNTFNNGYNSTKGGIGGNTYIKRSKSDMEKTKEKISKALQGERNGNKGQYVGERNPMYKKKPHNAQEVVLYNIVTKEVKIFDRAYKVANFLGYKSGSFVTRMKKDNLIVNNWKIVNKGVESIESVV